MFTDYEVVRRIADEQIAKWLSGWDVEAWPSMAERIENGDCEE